ncbi:MAG: hypothetical protein GY764_04385 [Halieaceae bacterium]|nr:hypothetical protein [Halieaceae bacterium]
MPLPSVGDEPALVAASGWGLSVSEDSKVKDAAWDFVKFAAFDPENAAQWNLASGTLPALKASATGDARDALVAVFPHFGPFLDILQPSLRELSLIGTWSGTRSLTRVSSTTCRATPRWKKRSRR